MSTPAIRSKRRRSRNQSKRQGGRSSTSGETFVTRRHLTGGRFTPPSNPPDVNFMPWVPVTLVISHKEHLSFKVQDILTYLKAQVDPTGRGFNKETSGDKRFVIQFRLLTIMAWNLSGRVISLSVDDFTDSIADADGRDQLCGLVDTGTVTHTPAVGYTLPLSAQQHVLRTDDKNKDMYLFDVNGSGGQFMTYIKILYRFDGPARHPSVTSPVEETNDMLGQISNKIVQKRDPSTLELTINGMKYVAEAVTLLSATSHPPPVIDPELIQRVRKLSLKSDESSYAGVDTDDV